MVVDAARMSLRNLFSPQSRIVFFKVLGLTLLVLFGLWLGLREAFMAFVLPWLQAMVPDLPDYLGWLGFIVTILASLGLALAMALLLSPVTALIAGLFLDDVAEVIERRDYPAQAPGQAMPFGPALLSSLSFLCVVVLGNIVAFMLLWVPGINFLAFFLVNGYLLGREFFEFAAMRYRSVQEARLFRAKHSSTVFLAGLIIAGFLAIPFVNLLTPLFAAGMMVHLHKALSARDRLARA